MPDLSGFLEDRPQVAFGTYLPQRGRMRDFFQRRYGDIYGEYQGLLGQQVLKGEMPTLRFVDFLRDIDWKQRYLGFSPYQRGEYPSRLTGGAARFLNY